METVLRNRAKQELMSAMTRWSENQMKWGVDDCMLAVADVVRNITGRDLAEGYRRRYSTRAGAYRVLGPGGVLRRSETVVESAGFEKIEPDDAEAGDIGLVPISYVTRRGRVVKNFSACICRDRGWFLIRSHRGFVAVPASKISHAWSIS